METFCREGGSMNINVGVLGGNLVRDPELKYTPSGTAICEFTIANSKTWKDGQTGEKKEKAGFYNCICWGRRGEIINEHFEKGKPILIKYDLDFQQWETPEGQKRSAVKFNVQDFDFVGYKADSTNSVDAQQKTSTPDAQTKLDIADEEIPF